MHTSEADTERISTGVVVCKTIGCATAVISHRTFSGYNAKIKCRRNLFRQFKFPRINGLYNGNLRIKDRKVVWSNSVLCIHVISKIILALLYCSQLDLNSLLLSSRQLDTPENRRS